MLNLIKWLVASISIVSMENMQQKIEESQNKDFVVYTSSLALRLSGIYQTIYSYEDNTFYAVKLNAKKNNNFKKQLEYLEKNKPINSKFQLRSLDPSKHNMIKYVIFESISYIKTFIEIILYINFIPLNICVHTFKFLFFKKNLKQPLNKINF